MDQNASEAMIFLNFIRTKQNYAKQKYLIFFQHSHKLILQSFVYINHPTNIIVNAPVPYFNSLPSETNEQQRYIYI